MQPHRFLLGLACAVGYHVSAAAGPLVLAPATPEALPSTLYVAGPPGEYVTQGREYRATSAEGFEFILTDNGPNGLYVVADNFNSEKDFDKQQSYGVSVGAPYHQLLKPGIYLSAYRFPTDPSQAQLDITVTTAATTPTTVISRCWPSPVILWANLPRWQWISHSRGTWADGSSARCATIPPFQP